MIEPTKAMISRQLDAVLAAHARLMEVANAKADKGAPGVVFACGMGFTLLLAWLARWLA